MAAVETQNATKETFHFINKAEGMLPDSNLLFVTAAH